MILVMLLIMVGLPLSGRMGAAASQPTLAALLPAHTAFYLEWTQPDGKLVALAFFAPTELVFMRQADGLPQGYQLFSTPGAQAELSAVTPAQSLLTQPDFKRLRGELAPQARLWSYANLMGQTGGAAVYAEVEQLSVALAWQGTPATTIPDPVSLDASAGVPQDAFFVYTGMGADLQVPAILQRLNNLTQAIANMENMPLLNQQIEGGVRVVLGVDLQKDLLPLFAGGYALYATRGESLPVLGLVLAPQTSAGFTLARISNRLPQTLNVDIALNAERQYVLDTGIAALPSFVYGMRAGRVYLGTASSAQATLAALDGQNILQNADWQRVYAAAPIHTQHMAFLAAPLPTGVYFREDADGLRLLRVSVFRP